MSLLSDTGVASIAELNARIDANLARRLRDGANITVREIADITDYSARLFPLDLRLTQIETDDFRALCAFSQVTLRPPLKIRSHRKWIGPVIVRAKQLMWPLLRFQLKDTFQGIQEFQCRSVVRMARELAYRKGRDTQ